MKYIIIRNKTRPDRLRLAKLPGLTNLTACHPSLLGRINNIEQRSKLVVQIQSKRLSSHCENMQERYEGLYLAALNGSKDGF